MKTNLKRLGSMVVAVGMMSALSLTAFAAESIPAAKLTASTVSVKAGDSVAISKIDGAKSDQISIEIGSGKSELLTLPGYDVKELADGKLELTDKKTGKKTTVVMVKAVAATPAQKLQK